MRDNETGEALMQRADDTEEVRQAGSASLKHQPTHCSKHPLHSENNIFLLTPDKKDCDAKNKKHSEHAEYHRHFNHPNHANHPDLRD